MRVLLCGKVPPPFELARRPSQPFPPYQAQTYWLRAIKQLGHQTTIFRYSDDPIIPSKLSAHLENYLSSQAPQVYRKYRLLKNKFYRYFPSNYIRAQQLSNLIKQTKPDAILLVGGISELTSSPLRLAEQLSIPIFLFHGEHPRISATKFELNHLGFFNWIICGNKNHASYWKKLGAKNAISIPYTGIDPTIHKSHSLTTQEKDRLSSGVVFIGTLFKERLQILKKLTSFNLSIYGYIPPSIGLDPQLVPFYHGYTSGLEMAKIYSGSKIALNFVSSQLKGGGNMRTFEIAGCGPLQITNSCDPDWFDLKKDLVIFNSSADLKNKINYYLRHPAKAKQIARRAHQKTHHHHTYKHRFRKILSLI